VDSDGLSQNEAYDSWPDDASHHWRDNTSYDGNDEEDAHYWSEIPDAVDNNEEDDGLPDGTLGLTSQ